MDESLTGDFGVPKADSDGDDFVAAPDSPHPEERGPKTRVPERPSPAPWERPDVPPAPELDGPPTESPEAASGAGGVVAAVGGLEEQVRKFHARSENQEQIIRQMQSRIEQLQGDQVQALLKPVLRRFAGLHAQAAEAAERARERGEKSEKDFDFFMDAIEESLGLIDVESVEAAPLVEFDPKKHHAARVVPTEDVELDKRVQRVLRQGFSYVDADRVFLPAQVSVYRYQPPQ
ncbi:nucleotide exchange factor GrpE [Nocardiopsis sp. NPDC006938]|uniref:nucleotide exchange factor GrpE n=1 Tax=Nocardiopsis sp. NPDC006938 TaxID=3364337 RepID=UPI003678EBDD